MEMHPSRVKWKCIKHISNHVSETWKYTKKVVVILGIALRAGTDGSMSVSGSAGPGFDPRRGSKYSVENFQPRG